MKVRVWWSYPEVYTRPEDRYEDIEVPFICDKCGFKEVLLVAYDLAKNRYEVDYEDTAFCNKDKKWRDKLLQDANLI